MCWPPTAFVRQGQVRLRHCVIARPKSAWMRMRSCTELAGGHICTAPGELRQSACVMRGAGAGAVARTLRQLRGGAQDVQSRIDLPELEQRGPELARRCGSVCRRSAGQQPLCSRELLARLFETGRCAQHEPEVETGRALLAL